MYSFNYVCKYTYLSMGLKSPYVHISVLSKVWV